MDVHVLALTATATKATFDCVCERVAMKSPSLIGLSPHRSNIYYSVHPYIDVQELSDCLAAELRLQSRKTPKTVIFCQRLEDTAMLYLSLQKTLGHSFTYPAGYPSRQQYRLVEMYTRACRPEFKESVLNSFTSLSGALRIVIATTAFGMGIDCPDIDRIIHWGAPSTLEQYAQETGRAGRDGRQATALMYYKQSGRHIEEAVHSYACNQTECRKQKLFRSFLFCNLDVSSVTRCQCCDVCACICTCESCNDFD